MTRGRRAQGGLSVPERGEGRGSLKGVRERGSDGVEDALVAKDVALLHRDDLAVVEVQVRAADGTACRQKNARVSVMPDLAKGKPLADAPVTLRMTSLS